VQLIRPGNVLRPQHHHRMFVAGAPFRHQQIVVSRR
jgi:hypothetical protein